MVFGMMPLANNSPSELESLALVYCCQYFRHYLLGITHLVETDHHSLCYLTSINSPSGRLAQWAIALSEFRFAIKYIKGKSNCGADCLSRYPVINTPVAMSVITNSSANGLVMTAADTVLGEIASAQKEDALINKMMERGNIDLVKENGILYKLTPNSVGLWKKLPYVPSS